jgi:hypothetical protein
MTHYGTYSPSYTVIRFSWVSAKFGTCTVVSVNGTLVDAKMCAFTLESTHFIFNKCPFYTHDGASVKFSTNSHETDYSVHLRTSCLALQYQRKTFSNMQHFFVTRLHTLCRISCTIMKHLPTFAYHYAACRHNYYMYHYTYSYPASYRGVSFLPLTRPGSMLYPGYLYLAFLYKVFLHIRLYTVARMYVLTFPIC